MSFYPRTNAIFHTRSQRTSDTQVPTRPRVLSFRCDAFRAAWDCELPAFRTVRNGRSVPVLSMLQLGRYTELRESDLEDGIIPVNPIQKLRRRRAAQHLYEEKPYDSAASNRYVPLVHCSQSRISYMWSPQRCCFDKNFAVLSFVLSEKILFPIILAIKPNISTLQSALPHHSIKYISW